jgi:zinc protease
MRITSIIICVASSLFASYANSANSIKPTNSNNVTNTIGIENKSQLNKQTYYYKLDNGLSLVIKPDNKSPTAIQMVWYKVGSIDESSNKTGLSHILEHLMFKGTKKTPEFSKVMADLGARENAFTNNSYTVYHQQLPSTNLKEAIYLEADRMRNLDLSKSKEFHEKFIKELNVIQEERRLRVDNQPDNKLYEQLLATAYIANGVRKPTIGWMDDIYNTKVCDARNWYNKYYHPNNATVVIVGDVNPAEVYNWVKDAYGVYKPEYNISYYNTQEPEQDGKRSVELHSKQVKDPSVYMLYKTPSYEDKPRHVLSLVLLSTLLSGYDYAYLDKKLVKQDKLLSSVSTSQGLIQRAKSHFLIYAKPYTNPDSIPAIIQTQITDFAKNITDSELNRAKKQWVANNVYKKDSLLNTAMELGVAYTNGYDYKIFDDIQANIQKISIDDIQEVVELYFTNKSLTVGTIIPENTKPL